MLISGSVSRLRRADRDSCRSNRRRNGRAGEIPSVFGPRDDSSGWNPATGGQLRRKGAMARTAAWRHFHRTRELAVLLSARHLHPRLRRAVPAPLALLPSLGVCRNNAKRVHSTTSPSHFGTILASGADASALKTDRLWGGHPTFSSRHDFSDTLLARAPRERGEVPVVLARRVVPVDTEGVQVAPRGLCESEARRGRVADVVEVDRFGWARTGNALDGDVEHARDRHRPAHPAPLDPDRLRLHSSEGADQRAHGGHGTAALPASDRGQRLALLGCGPLVHYQPDCPVPGDHCPRGVEQHGKAEAVERGRSIRAALDVKNEAGVAVPLGRPPGETRGGARADGVAAARLEVVTADLPLWARHDDPPRISGAITSCDRPGARSRARDAAPPPRREAEARPRSRARSILPSAAASRPPPPL